MKALMNTKSKELFKRYEKPAETTEMKMNAIEMKQVAAIVGIDLGELSSMNWFFELVNMNQCRYKK